MNGEWPFLAVAGSGSAMLAGIHLRERRIEEAMRRSRQRWHIQFPEKTDPLFIKAALLALAGGDESQEFVFSVESRGGNVEHFAYVAAAIHHSFVSAITGALPGVQLTEAPAPAGRATLSAKVHLTTPSVLSDAEPEAVVHTLLAGIADLAQGETAILRVAARPATPGPWHPAEPADRAARETQRRWQQKIGAGPGFDVSMLALVKAGSISRAREICDHLTSVLRSRRGPVGTIRVTNERGNRSLASLPRTTRSSGWLTAAELIGSALAWPLGEAPVPGVSRATRTLLAPPAVPRKGVRLFVGRDRQGEREVAISPELLKQHLLLAGRTGSGKSTLSAGAFLSLIEQGFALCLIDPKADTFDAVLRRVPKEQAHRVTVIDPGDPHHPLPGLKLMTLGDSPDLQADALSGAIRSAFPAEAWGVRTSFYLGLAVRTLAAAPRGTLTDIARLLMDEPYLRSTLVRVRDPYLRSAWAEYLALSPAARAERVQAPMNRLMNLLMRAPLRAILNASEPKLDVGELLGQRGVLLVNLAPGVLGEAGAAMLGSIAMHAIWMAIERRVKLSPEQRTPVFIVVDELASLLGGVPFNFELLVERARGLGAGLLVNIQTLGRIAEPTRGALLGNVLNLITFASTEDVREITRQLPGLTEADIRGLPRYHVAARLGTSAGSVILTGRTEPLPEETGMAETIRAASAEHFASAPEVTSDAQDDLPDGDDERPVGRARRSA
jgi:hypothetical protein